MKGYRLQATGYSLLALIFFLFTVPCTLFTTFAIVDPLSVPNNKFGIHLIQATQDESSPAAQLANTNGDWGYITLLAESKDRNHNKWQEFFDDLRVRHLIPIIRLATKPLDEHWEKPYEGEEQAWADFLNRLNWPVKNRYVVAYNEPNNAKEWGNTIDPVSYAQVLSKTIDALKNKSSDFFVLNAGFDASAPSELPQYEDEVNFLRQMNESVPGIFEKLDGWVSHSYPNPDFSGSPNATGRGSIRTWYWELQFLLSLGVTKNLPVFITETGWKHAEGIDYDLRFPSADTVAKYYKQAFESAWNNQKIIAVTPFLLNYQQKPFDHFSFKKISSKNSDVLGIQYPEYYPQYEAIKNMAKVVGSPIQENKAQLTKGEIYSSLSANQIYEIPLTFKNIGQSIWNDGKKVKLVPVHGGSEFALDNQEIPRDIKIEPGKEYTFNIRITTLQSGSHKIALNLFSEEKQFDSPPFEFNTTIKAPVILKVRANLKWKKSSKGDYILRIEGPTGETIQNINLSSNGNSSEKEARYLLPDYSFTFALERPYYKAKKISQTLQSGVNILDFNELEPDLMSALLHPRQLWKLLPLSNGD